MINNENNNNNIVDSDIGNNNTNANTSALKNPINNTNASGSILPVRNKKKRFRIYHTMTSPFCKKIYARKETCMKHLEDKHRFVDGRAL